MKFKKIAYVNDIDIFNINSLSDIKFARKYHAIYLHYLINKVKNDYELVWADKAIEMIKNGKWNSKEVLIIQEMSSKKGNMLVKLGAIPLISICYEGPFIGHSYYEKINYFGKLFKKIIIYDNNYPNLQFNKNKILNVGFPCIESHQIETHFKALTKKEWDTKKLIVGIWANKHYSLHKGKILYHLKNKHYKYLIYEILSKLISKTYRANLKNQLIDKRNQTFINISKIVKFDLIGKGWHSSHEVPKKVRLKMNKYKNNIFDGSLHKFEKLTKNEIYKDYKFALCFENTSSKSYITEKIFDCFVNKIIPIYLGAPDINNYVPENCFIDYRSFNNDQQLIDFLENFTLNDANKYLYNAQKFLLSKDIKKNKCEFFAETIIDEIKKINNK